MTRTTPPSNKPRNRRYSPRRVRLSLSYSVQEVSALFGLHKNAVRNWIRDGLRTIDTQKPRMIHGSDLADYLTLKQSRWKRACKPDEFYCFKCRLPRRTWANVVDIAIRNDSKLDLCGLCETCSTEMHRAGAVRKLAEYQKTFDIQKMRDERITASPSPVARCDIGKDAQRDEMHT